MLELLTIFIVAVAVVLCVFVVYLILVTAILIKTGKPSSGAKSDEANLGFLINDAYYSFKDVDDQVTKVDDGAYFLRQGDDVPPIIPALVALDVLAFDDTFANENGLPLQVIKGKLYDKYRQLSHHLNESQVIMAEFFGTKE